MPFRFDGVPHLLDSSIVADEYAAPHYSLERAAHKLLPSPKTIRFNHFVVGVAQEGEIELVFLFETQQRFHRIGAHTNNLNLQRVEVLLCVTKLGRFHGSTRCVGLRIEKEQCALALKIR